MYIYNKRALGIEKKKEPPADYRVSKTKRSERKKERNISRVK
jgi:hypothetical protein